MIVGILSDTHDRLRSARAGLDLLRPGEHIFHCGDVGAEPILDLLAGLPATVVLGNNDWDVAGLARYAQDLQVELFPKSGSIVLDGKSFAITHGDQPALVRRLLDSQEHDYLLLGHSHVRADQRIGRTRLINPGALHRASVKTVALLDTRADALRFLEVKD